MRAALTVLNEIALAEVDRVVLLFKWRIAGVEPVVVTLRKYDDGMFFISRYPAR